jgi:2-C-methyl-D-erythritol 4-phosphate cytidylyltransferase
VASKALIVPAAGAGSRMQKDTPKPYLHLSGRTILEHTIRQFLPLDCLEHVVVATSSEYLSDAKRILRSVKSSKIRADCVVGGKKRQDSIYNALKEVADVDLVMVHDAVRPFVKLQHINKCCKVAGNTGAAVLGIPAKDTIKKVNDRQEVQETPERKYLWQTQTPQVFQKNLLIEAYESARKETFTGTDDSSLVERLGHTVKMVEGDQSNFKITYPLDLQLAELLIDKD